MFQEHNCSVTAHKQKVWIQRIVYGKRSSQRSNEIVLHKTRKSGKLKIIWLYWQKLWLSVGPGLKYCSRWKVFSYTCLNPCHAALPLTDLSTILDTEHSYHFSSYHWSCSTDLKMQRWLSTAPVLFAILLCKPQGKSFVDSAIKLIRKVD